MKQAVITIHGIHTRDMTTWQDDFRVFAKAQNPDVKFFQYEYGYTLGVFAWWANLTNYFGVPEFFRNRAIRHFSDYITRLQKKFPDYEFSILAHSFGTWISYNAMICTPEINLNNLVLVGGVISEHWERLQIGNWLEEGRVNSVHAYWAHDDSVVGYIAVEPFGKLGRYGFIRKNVIDDLKEPLPQPYPGFRIFNWQHEGHGGALKFLDKYGKTLLNSLTYTA